MTRFGKFLGEETGAAMLEYALILVLLGVGMISIVTTLGYQVRDTFQLVGSKM